MPDLVMSRRMFAGVPVTVFATVGAADAPHERRRAVALGRITRRGGEVAIEGRLDPVHSDVSASGRCAR